MESIELFFKLGFGHVLDPQALDHLFFISAFTIPFQFKDARQLLWWTTLFTVGHTLSLVGNYYFEINPSARWIEFFIPLSILIACVPLITGTSAARSQLYLSGLIFIFGIVHGFGFSRYFGMIVPEEQATTALLSFALGVEGAQIVIIIGVLCVAWLLVAVFSMPKEKWKLVAGTMIASQALEMTLQNWPL